MRDNQKIIHEIDQAIKSKSEKTFLDFKQQWSDNKADLIHDILALSNCDFKNDRYLVFGITNQFSVKGIEGDANRKNTENLTTIMRDANFNKFPNIEVREIIYQESVLDVIIIKYDNEHNRPFYIEKLDEPSRKGNLRAGAIYSRNNDANTPKDRTANKFEIEKMWREHLGIDKSALQRFKIYLEKPEDWEKCDGGYYYKYFPEFRIIINYNWGRKSSYLKANWRIISAENTEFATMHEVSLQYHSTILYKNNSAEIDNDHTSIMHPEHTMFDKNGDQNSLVEEYLFFYFFEDCLPYVMSKFLIAKSGCERPNGVFCYDVSEFNPHTKFIFILKEGDCNIRTTIKKLSQNTEKMKLIEKDKRFLYK